VNKRELARFKKIIEAELLAVRQRLGMIEDEVASHSSNQTGGQSHSNHMADVGTAVMEQEQTYLHASQGTDYLISLESALERIERGTYGVCEDCGGKIPVRRLEAYPAARRCIACKSLLERHQRH
jgi:DnaK suppressor protein